MKQTITAAPRSGHCLAAKPGPTPALRLAPTSRTQEGLQSVGVSCRRARNRVVACILAWALLPGVYADDSLSSLILADELARYAISSSDPLALLTAVRILRINGLNGSRARMADDEKTASRLPSRLELLKLAETMSQGQPQLLALLAAEGDARNRGTVRGPQAERLLIRSGKLRELTLAFEAGKPAVFGVVLDRLHELDFDVMDSEGQLLCEPIVRSTERRCEWITANGGEVRIRLQNRGSNALMLTFFHD